MKAPTATPPSLNGRPGSGSRATSPSAPNMGGHSMVAKRATSPKIPRPKNAASRATSPLAGSLSSRTSPAASRAGSPPAPSGSGAQKRKATEDGSIPPKPKKQRPAGELNAQKLIDWLEKTEKASTRDCIAAFAGYTHNEEAKKLFTRLVKEVAILKGGFLVLRPGGLSCFMPWDVLLTPVRCAGSGRGSCGLVSPLRVTRRSSWLLY
jgi:transcription initiation factor TFIIF subunit alpha